MVKWIIKWSMTHQANVRTICRPLTIPKEGDRYFIGEFSKRVSKCRWSIEISRIGCWLFDLLDVFFMSDSNGSTVISLSKVNSSIVGPDVVLTKSFSFVISQVKQLFIFLVRFSQMKTRWVVNSQHQHFLVSSFLCKYCFWFF